MYQVGTLIVKPQSAKITISTELFGKMDPYVKIKIGNNTYQSAVAQGQHKTPTWTDTFSFKINGESAMELTVLEKDTLSKDDLIGEATVQLGEMYLRKNGSNWHEIRKEGKVTGQIMISFEYFPGH